LSETRNVKQYITDVSGLNMGSWDKYHEEECSIVNTNHGEHEAHGITTGEAD